MYYRPRIIPCLSIDDGEMVKTIHFQKPRYLGDVVNAVKIFNNKGVDELSILDISATRRGKEPNFDLLKDIATEAFMPLSYGGGVTEIEQIKKLFYIGYEKIQLLSKIRSLCRRRYDFPAVRAWLCLLTQRQTFLADTPAIWVMGRKSCRWIPYNWLNKRRNWEQGKFC